MQLEHSFTVPVPVEVAWQALLDPQRVAPCFPGATLTGVDGSEFTGTVKVRLGPISLLYKGSGRFADADESARRLVLEATGKDSRGNGTAHARVIATLAPANGAGSGAGSGSGSGTTVGVITDLTITGRPAQLGRGLVGEVGSKILDAFANCLATRLTESEAAAAPPPVNGPSPQSDGRNGPSTQEPAEDPAPAPQAPIATPQPVGAADEINLIELAGAPVLRRLAPAMVAVIAALLVLRWLRRRG